MFSSQEGHLYIRARLLYLIVCERGRQQLPLLKPQSEKKGQEEKGRKEGRFEREQGMGRTLKQPTLLTSFGP